LTAQEVINVIPVTQQVNIVTLDAVIEQAIVAANEPLKG
jgi:hypothetical protein